MRSSISPAWRAWGKSLKPESVKTLGVASGIVASVLCFLAGAWLLDGSNFGEGQGNYVWAALGLYFIGKAFFVGPLLAINAWSVTRPTPAARDQT